MISSSEVAYLLALHQVKGIGNRAIQSIYEHQISFEQAWKDPQLLVEQQIIDRNVHDLLLAARRFLAPEECLVELQKHGCACITRWTDGYPECLNELYDVPAVIYYQGNLNLFHHVAVGIVGARAATVYGKKVASWLAKELGDAGISTVSGVARGIDSAAHQAALATEGSTIGVLGCGLNIVYPPENQKLYQMIIKNGLLISEFPLGCKPNPGHFPRRNRIIAALSRAIVVVEANEKSGALITADHAIELGRDVWAVPGPITSPQSKGTNRLIRDGALLVLEPEDILSSLYPGRTSPMGKAGTDYNLTLDESRIMQAIGEYPVHLDEIASSIDYSRGDLINILLKLELKGIITCLAGNYYVRK